MDLHLGGGAASAEERAAVDTVLGAPTSRWRGAGAGIDAALAEHFGLSGGDAARAERHRLLPVLHALQDRLGWLSRGALDYVSLRLDVPPAEVWGVASFYHLLALEPQAPAVAHVCDDIACRLRGAEALCDELAQSLGPAGQGSQVTWKRSPCLGLCEAAPAALVLRAGAPATHQALAPVTAAAIRGALATPLPAATLAPPTITPRIEEVRRAVPDVGDPGHHLLARVGRIDPASVADYRAHGGYAGLTRAIALGADATIAEVTASRLVGRGGAAFPTGRKWQAVAAQPVRERSVVCNADESEPGTFKDRVLCEWDPLAIIEGMTIAALATGASRGFIYLRGEYPRAAAHLEAALAAARAAGLLGADVAGAGFAFDIELYRGAGAYICGEETALFNSIEGRRGEPRAKPPFPVEAGLFGRPTVINNVETLASVPLILAHGGAAFAAIGTAGSAGPKLFCVSGAVARPGVYEAPFGITLAELIGRAGGIPGDRPLRAVLLGGAAGSFVGPEALPLPLTLEALRAAGATLGSGVVMVLDDGADLPDLVRRIARFFRDESCGQCVPCRVGTVRQDELLVRLHTGTPLGSRADEHALFGELAQAMRDASICGLGQTASAAIESALRLGLLDPPAAASAP